MCLLFEVYISTISNNTLPRHVCFIAIRTYAKTTINCRQKPVLDVFTPALAGQKISKGGGA